MPKSTWRSNPETVKPNLSNGRIKRGLTTDYSNRLAVLKWKTAEPRVTIEITDPAAVAERGRAAWTDR